MTTNLPGTSEQWLAEIALAYLDAKEAQPFGELTGAPITEGDLFQLAPQVFLKFRHLQASQRRQTEIIEAALASYVATLEDGVGRSELRDSPLLSFAFCYLAAHFAAGLLDEEAVEHLMEVCVAQKEELSRLVVEGS